MMTVPVRNGVPHCFVFSFSSNYQMAQQLYPMIRHYYEEPRPGGPMGEYTEQPWDLLRKIMPYHHYGQHAPPEVWSDFEDFRDLLRPDALTAHPRLTADVAFLRGAGGTTVLREIGFDFVPDVEKFTYAWALILRVYHAQEVQQHIVDAEMSLTMQLFIDSHLRLSALIFINNIRDDVNLLRHRDFFACTPVWTRGATYRTLPNLVHLTDQMDIFFDTRGSDRTQLGKLLHTLAKQMPHTCVIRAVVSIFESKFRSTPQIMWLYLDVVLIYALLGNYVLRWPKSSAVPLRPSYFTRMAMVQMIVQIAATGAAAAENMLKMWDYMFLFAVRLFFVDIVHRNPSLAATLGTVFSMANSTHEINFSMNRMREMLDQCDWRALMVTARGQALARRRHEIGVALALRRGERPPTEPPEMKTPKGAMEALLRESGIRGAIEETNRRLTNTHLTTLIFQFKLRKLPFARMMARILTNLLEKKKELGGVALVPPSKMYLPEEEPFLEPQMMRVIHVLALHIAPRNDGHFPVEMLTLLGIPDSIFEKVRDTYGAYESDTPDHPIARHYEEMFEVAPEAVVVIQRLFKLVDRIRGFRVVQTSWQTKARQLASLYQRYMQVCGHITDVFQRDLDLCYYCECGQWMTPIVDPTRNAKNLHALGLDRAGFDPIRGYLHCGRKRGPECMRPARTIHMAGKVMLLNKKWYALCTERGCGCLTTVDVRRMGTFGPVCGMHPTPQPRLLNRGWPPAEILGKRGGRALAYNIKQQVPPPNERLVMRCGFCGTPPMREGGGLVDVYERGAVPPFHKIYLCIRHLMLYNSLPRTTWEKSDMFEELEKLAPHKVAWKKTKVKI